MYPKFIFEWLLGIQALRLENDAKNFRQLQEIVKYILLDLVPWYIATDVITIILPYNIFHGRSYVCSLSISNDSMEYRCYCVRYLQNQIEL